MVAVLASGTLLGLAAEGIELVFGTLILLAVILSEQRLNPRNGVIAGAASAYIGTIAPSAVRPSHDLQEQERPLWFGPICRRSTCLPVFVLTTLVPSGYLSVTEI